jgi:hypothetical protein
VAYDEGGGFYDHVAPPTAIKTADGLIGSSTRLPALVISPYAKQNYVSHVQYDHTSILKFLEWINGEIDLNGADKTHTTVTLQNEDNKADHSMQSATYGQTLPSQYGDYGVTSSVSDIGKLQKSI